MKDALMTGAAVKAAQHAKPPSARDAVLKHTVESKSFQLC